MCAEKKIYNEALSINYLKTKIQSHTQCTYKYICIYVCLYVCIYAKTCKEFFFPAAIIKN